MYIKEKIAPCLNPVMYFIDKHGNEKVSRLLYTKAANEAMRQAGEIKFDNNGCKEFMYDNGVEKVKVKFKIFELSTAELYAVLYIQIGEEQIYKLTSGKELIYELDY